MPSVFVVDPKGLAVEVNIPKGFPRLDEPKPVNVEVVVVGAVNGFAVNSPIF